MSSPETPEPHRPRKKDSDSVSVRSFMGLLIGSLVVQLCFCLYITTRYLSTAEKELSAIQGRLTELLAESQTRYSQLYVIETSLATLIHSNEPKQLRNAYLNATASSFMAPGDLSEEERSNFALLQRSMDDIWALRQQLASATEETHRLWQSLRTIGTTIDARTPEKKLDLLFGDEHTLAPSDDQVDALLDAYVEQFERYIDPDSAESALLRDLRRFEADYVEVKKEREALRAQILRKVSEATTALDAVRHVYTANRSAQVLGHVDAIGKQVRDMRPGLAVLFVLNATEFLIFLYLGMRFARPIERTSRILEDFQRTYEMPRALPESNITEVRTLLKQLPRLLTAIATEREKLDRMRSERDVYRGLSYTDGLTAVSNRLAFERDNDAMTPLPERTGVIILDIDKFKPINDTYGHALGDEVLRTVAEFLRGSARSHDRVYRYGGEEFCIVTKGANREALVRVAERIRSGIEKLEFRTPDGRPFRVTASLGASLCDETSGPVDSLRTLTAVADDALYEAKRDGRNRSVFRSVT